MSLPSNIILPFRPSQLQAGGPEFEKYMRDLINKLQDMYGDLVNNINGRFAEFTPEVQGSSATGSATYSTQTGLLLRQGLLTTIWFHVAFTGNTATGNAYITLPYEVSNQSGTPFPGVVESSGITYTGFDTLTLNAEPNSFRAYIWKNGTGATRTNLAVPASGTLIGQMVFWGKEDEN